MSAPPPEQPKRYYVERGALNAKSSVSAKLIKDLQPALVILASHYDALAVRFAELERNHDLLGILWEQEKLAREAEARGGTELTAGGQSSETPTLQARLEEAEALLKEIWVWTYYKQTPWAVRTGRLLKLVPPPLPETTPETESDQIEL